MTFRTRLTILVGSAVALSIATASAVLFILVSTLLNSQIDDQLTARMSDLSQFAANAALICPTLPAGGPGAASPSPAASPTSSPPVGPGASAPSSATTPCPLPTNLRAPIPQLGGAGGQVQFIDGQGVATLTLDGGVPLPVSASARALAAAESGPDIREDAVVGGIPVRVVTHALGHGRAVQVGLRLDGIESVLGSLRLILLAVSLVGVAIAVGLGRWIAGSAMRPVSRLMVATEHVAGTHDLRERIPEPGNDELGRLANSFNRMLEALDASEHVQRQLVADASHELRTPLSSLRTNIEVLALGRGLSDDDRERLLGSLTGQVERLSHLVADVIDLARGDEPREALLVETRLDELAASSVDVARSHYPELHIELAAQPCLVIGDPGRIRRAIDNLLDNAGKWSPAGGRVDVTAKDGEVSVRDHGPGVEPADREHVFDRFWRAPTARATPGSGLGLAIVQQVAHAHGGEVRLETPADGGSRFVLRLPVAAEPLDGAGDDDAVVQRDATTGAPGDS
jgi:two-component system, OmpR family, sensor histidine kinase MprB